jgi:hypothetical protein
VKPVARLLCASSVAAGAAALALAGCPSTTTTTGYTPYTGVIIRSSQLVAGFGCGTGPGQVYRYAAVVYHLGADAGPTGNAFASNVFDCFSDGVFENLDADDAGNTSYFLTIQAYERASFPPGLSCDPAGACPTWDVSTVLASAAQASWTTTCTATQQAGVPVLAVCQPLGAADGGAGDASADAAAEATVDGGADALGDGPFDAPADATTDGSADAADAGDAGG